MKYLAVLVQTQDRDNDVLYGPFDTKQEAQEWLENYEHGIAVENTEVWFINEPNSK